MNISNTASLCTQCTQCPLSHWDHITPNAEGFSSSSSFTTGTFTLSLPCDTSLLIIGCKLSTLTFQFVVIFTMDVAIGTSYKGLYMVYLKVGTSYMIIIMYLNIVIIAELSRAKRAAEHHG